MRILTSDTPLKVGETVELSGWVANRRDHGKLIFLDLRDRGGIIQMVVTPKSAAYETANKLRSEWVIKVSGLVKARPEGMINKDIATGTVELSVTELEVLNEAQTPPFPIDTDGQEIGEENRLKYRYLDLRRPRVHKNIQIRSEYVQQVRSYLLKQGFTEIETPYFTSTTPEGSRDFIVPSRMYPGQFFALPQSPQQYKQLLQVAGFERYFQLARCFRDEDLRADRGFEHTQVDIEMSFVNQEEVMQLVEGLMITVFEAMGKTIRQKPFPRFTYAEAMAQFGADKFDMRTAEEKAAGVLAFAWVTQFPFFEKDKEGQWTFTHNPFSMPEPEHLEWHLKGENIEKIVTQQYDLVCNGFEVGGGSIRAHRPEILKATLKTMGYADEQIQSEFGHMLEAFSFGAPPHGGIAFGVERMIMILTGEQYLREVQAFPQTAKGHPSVMNAPTPVALERLREYGLKVDEKYIKK
jgi:aspartyl-tRNA synthetase